MTIIAGEEVLYWTFYISWRMRIWDLLPGFKIKIFWQADFIYFFSYTLTLIFIFIPV